MNLYLLENQLGIWYVLEKDPTSAQRTLEEKLKEADYGFFEKRRVFKIELIASEGNNFSVNRLFRGNENE